MDFEEGGQNVCGECGFTFRRPVRVAPRASGGRLPTGGKFVQRDVVSRRRLADQDRVVTPAVPTDIDVITVDEEDSDTEMISDDGHEMVGRGRNKRRKPRLAPLLFLCAWFAAAMMVVLFVRKRINRETAPVVNQVELEERRREQAQKAQIEDYLRRQIPECRIVLNRFFDGGDAAMRAQAVRDPVRVTPMMAAYYQKNPPRRPSGVLKPLLQNLYVEGDRRAIETVWRDPDGEEMEVVFIRQEGQWRIDWEAFVRFGTADWLLFSDGTPREAELRLYIRRLETTQHSEDTLPTIGLKFYPPSYDPRLRTRGESDAVLVPLKGTLVERLLSVFAARERTPGIGETKLAHRDPEGLYRVRATLAWKEGTSCKPYLQLKELVAANWYGEGFEDVGLKEREDAGDTDQGEEEAPEETSDADREDSGEPGIPDTPDGSDP
mgnify:CR=1 FL=1